MIANKTLNSMMTSRPNEKWDRFDRRAVQEIMMRDIYIYFVTAQKRKLVGRSNSN